MKALNAIFNLLIICLLLLTGCTQVTKSIKDTFKPDDTAIKQQKKKQGQTSSATTTTTTRHIQSTEVIINGDTLNTKDIQEKTKTLFKDLETLQKNKTGNNNEQIQEKVNEFLKSINMPQKTNAPANTRPK